MLIFGISLLLVTGLCWVGIAVVVSDAADHHRDLNKIQFYTSALLAVIALAVLAFQLPLAGDFRSWLRISIPVFLAGAMNFVMLALMKWGMRSGSPGAVWGIVQSALICPFLMGILCFHVAPTATRLAGIVLIIAGIMLFSQSKPRRKASGSRWLLPTGGAFLVSGLAQSLANLPSYQHELTMPSVLRALLVQGGTIGAFAIFFLARRRNDAPGGTFRTIVKPVLLLTSAQLLALFFCFYRGLDLVAKAGAGSIGYPIAQGSCIVFFMLYEKLRFRKKYPLSAWLALIVQCLGLSVISL